MGRVKDIFRARAKESGPLAGERAALGFTGGWVVGRSLAGKCRPAACPTGLRRLGSGRRGTSESHHRPVATAGGTVLTVGGDGDQDTRTTEPDFSASGRAVE